MAKVTYAEPTTTRTPLHFDVLPPIQQASPIATPATTRQPFNVQQTTPGQLARPINYHAQPQNVPSVQEQIRRDGATWKTIDVKPNNTASPNTRFQDPTLPMGVSQADVEGTAAFGKFLLGFGDQISGQNTLQRNDYQVRVDQRYIFTPLENFSYEVGRRTADGVQDFGESAKQKLDDLWKNRPQFEIPTIKVPKFNIPGMPDLSIPKIPEFDIPELPKIKFPGLPEPRIPEPESKPQPTTQEKDIPTPREPKPKPIPPTLIRKLRELDLSPCGSISFAISYVTKTLGEYFVPNEDNTGGHFEQITVPSSLDEVYGLFSGWYTSIYQNDPDFRLPTMKEWVESGGGTGSNKVINLGGGISYRVVQGIGNGVYGNGSPYGSGYPKYYASQDNIAVDGLKDKTSINYLLDSLSFSGRTPEVYWLDISNPDAKDCPINKIVLPEPPPLPPQDCDCAMTCCPEIDYRKIKALIDDAVENIALAAPDSWLIRPEHHRPQLIVQFGEMLGNKKVGSPKYTLTIPHPKPNKPNKSAIPAYKKGNWEIIFVLKDNSKITIHALNEIEGMKVLNAAKALVIPDYLKGGYLSKSGKVITPEPLAEIQVTPKMAKYFPNGRKSQKPEWIVKF
ncbi:hypothetical protein [Nostoc sp. NMS9]|uniref:hypothetical protein n=1 Tax=Nostoc sp. NMS9 TaxID=2815393 RepID=UPI0025FD9A2C|nr:hypothetical protein [Nostoc sp. NMS9]MBN3944120.1 hypothetical protein [Nostoc sp. NMS9]